MIQTRSSFYFIESVRADNFALNFDEGAGELLAEIPSGDYTHTALAEAVQDALNSVGTNTYAAVFSRASRSFTISADSNFDLLIQSGSQAGSGIFGLIGFTGGVDLTGLSSYQGAPAGFEYLPQFYLQDFIDQEDLRRAASSSINKSATGEVEVVSFGVEKFFEFELKFITSIEQGKMSVVESNPTGLEDARRFLRFATSKRKIEFMKDRNNKSDFFDVLLESTSDSQNGTGYRLKELYSDGLVDYYNSGLLVFRVSEV